MSADLILTTGRFTTLDRSNPIGSAVAISNGLFTAVGREEDVMRLAGPSTRIIDLKGRRVLPGLIDNHLHIIRGGLNFNMELRWDGVRNLADAMAMLKRQVAITPPPQWVRVVGGFTAHQFAEKRLPTIEELNAVAPDTPVFLLHLYDRALAQRRRAEGGRLYKGHSRSTGRRDCSRHRRQSDRAARRQAECRHLIRNVG
jgi:predicted amidohydrolase YtcJ